ncbi:MAG: hypothetical protein J6D33_11480, partial [Turicibacter sp.]|nr:hypothetical protein [Turicibacter sp.]
MKMRKRLLVKLGALFLATSTILSSVPIYATTNTSDKLVVSNTQYDRYQDLVNIQSQFNALLSSKEFMASGKFPYELYGPVVSYAIVLRELQNSQNSAGVDTLPTRYQTYLEDM